MRRLIRFLADRRGSAAAELALVIPMMLALMFGSLELGNLFLDEHALSKQVRDGARYGARLELSNTYDCDAGDIFQDANAEDKIINVTKEGVVSGSNTKARWTSYWDRACGGDGDTVTVEYKCVPKSSIDPDDTGFTGIYTGLSGEIPVVRVIGEVQYRSVLAAIGFDATDICLRAESEAAVAGV